MRADRPYLVARGGGHLTLIPKKALLIGCGAIGGHIAFELARSGIGELTLVDPQALTRDNLFRHVLGQPHLGKPKAEAIRDELISLLPFVKVTAIPNRLEEALACGAVRLAEFDVVVMATGNPTLEMAVDREVQAEPDLVAVYAWVEPLGLGGHAVRTVGGQPGCVECLYARDGESGLRSRAAFAGRDQQFDRSLTGCGSSHTPYGSVDALQSAAIASRLAIGALLAADEEGAQTGVVEGRSDHLLCLVSPLASACRHGPAHRADPGGVPALRLRHVWGRDMMANDSGKRRARVRNRRVTGRVQFGDEVWELLHAYRQQHAASLEAGGVLLGRRLLTFEDIVVDEITIPMEGTSEPGYDSTGRAAVIRRLSRVPGIGSEQTIGYLGEWHSHPERQPTPSLLDRCNWAARLLLDRVTEPLFFVIVGIEMTEVWESYRWRKVPRFERLL